MKIVYLDAATVNPAEIDLSALNEFGEVKIYERTTANLVLNRAQGADIILTNKAILSREIINQLPDLKYIGVTATGYNVVDVVAAKEQGIVVTNAKNYSSMSVAQHVFALILAFTNRIKEHAQPVRWMQAPDFCYYDYSLTELVGKTIGLIGIGDIGEKVAQIATAFEMRVLVNRKSYQAHEKYETVSLERIYAESDFISLHCPLTAENEGFINADSLKKMKPNAILINTARGPLINEADLRKALDEGIISGAGLDVLSQEPPVNGNALFGAKNLIISPHIAWATLEARKRLMEIVYENIRAFLRGEAVNVVG